MSQSRPLDPDLAEVLDLHQQELSADDRMRHAQLDRPFMFGDCPVDNLQGILNIARNAATLLRAPSLPNGTWPIIAVGSGPSVPKHLPAIKALQDRCIIIAAASALKPLQDYGIQAHLCSPLERTDDTLQYIAGSGQNTRFAGAPLVAPAMTRLFEKHNFIANMDSMYDWCALPTDRRIYFGSSTGTMAVSLAASMTTGPVYLVGHDLAFADGLSHWDASTSIHEKNEGMTIEGNNGQIQ